MLPSLIVIGASKAGTTTLHQLLDLHPQISMSREKELDFFVDPAEDRDPDRPARPSRGTWPRGPAWYAAQFDGPGPVHGDTSHRYTSWPLNAEAPARMAALVPDARLVYLVRDPLARIISAYRMNVRMGWEARPFAEAVAVSDAGFYVGASKYTTQIDRYLEHFPREQLLVLDVDELDREPGLALGRCFAHAGVDPSFRSEGFHRRYNVGAAVELRGTPAVGALADLTDRAIGTERAARLGVLARRLRPRRAGLPASFPVDERTREALEVRLRPEVERLRELTGLPLAGWSI